MLRTDADFSAAIALTFRLDLMNMFYEGDLYAGTGVDPRSQASCPRRATRRMRSAGSCAARPSLSTSTRYSCRTTSRTGPGSTRESLIAENRLEHHRSRRCKTNPDYYALTNADDLILDADELAWLRATLGERIAVYAHGGHLGNLGERQQVADMLEMLAGTLARCGSVTAARGCLPVLLGAILLVSGCASSDFSVRSDPPETPAADNAAAIKQHAGAGGTAGGARAARRSHRLTSRSSGRR